MAKPLWLISYDISCPSRLRRIQKYCAAHGWALQKSLYVFALDRKERLETCAELTAMLEQEEDRLLCLPFSTPEGSFHLTPISDIVLVHDDPRLDSFVF